MWGLGTKEIIIIAIIFILLFGAKKIPELAKSLVDSVRHMRGAFKDGDDSSKDMADASKKK
jgi:sec-independent protein translocase protein TatA